MDERGVPLSIVVTGANKHDVSQLEAVLRNKIATPIMQAQTEHLCADAGYAGKAPRERICEAGDEPHVCPRTKKRRKRLETH